MKQVIWSYIFQPYDLIRKFADPVFPRLFSFSHQQTWLNVMKTLTVFRPNTRLTFIPAVKIVLRINEVKAQPKTPP